MKSTNFFERIMKIAVSKGFKSINDFSLNGLKYKSSEKINRLKSKNKQPSVEILIDISNMFEDIDPAWLLTGKGEMIKQDQPPPTADSEELGKLKEENSRLKDKIINLLEENTRLKDEAATKSNKHTAPRPVSGKLTS